MIPLHRGHLVYIYIYICICAKKIYTYMHMCVYIIVHPLGAFQETNHGEKPFSIGPQVRSAATVLTCRGAVPIGPERYGSFGLGRSYVSLRHVETYSLPIAFGRSYVESWLQDPPSKSPL